MKNFSLYITERECAEVHVVSPMDNSHTSLLAAQRLLSLHFADLAHTEARQRGQIQCLLREIKMVICWLCWWQILIQSQTSGYQAEGGDLAMDPTNIINEFIAFFSTLYAPIPPYDLSALDSLLGDISLPVWSEADRNVLDAKITTREIEAATSAFPPHKVPGPDGFPADFYKSYVELLAPRLIVLLEHHKLPNSILDAYMILFI